LEKGGERSHVMQALLLLKQKLSKTTWRTKKLQGAGENDMKGGTEKKKREKNGRAVGGKREILKRAETAT